MKSIIKVAILFVASLMPVFAFAGTAQIYSPAGLPQSSTQSYTPPTPENAPTVTFPTQPLPLGEGGLQGFSGTSFSVGAANTQPLSSPASTNGAPQLPLPSTLETNSIESFFQFNSVAKTSHKKSMMGMPVKIIWHILDNLGVPMMVGKDNDLDPSLRQSYVLPPSKGSTPSSIQDIPHKIPESELEGIEDTLKHDAKKSAL